MLSQYRNFLHLLKGSALSQIIILASTPILTRLYSPSDIGEFLFIFFIAALIGESSTLRLESALFIENNKTKLKWLKGGALSISFYISIIFCPLVFGFFFLRNGGILGEAIINTLLTSIIAFSFGARHTMHAWVVRMEQTHIAGQAIVIKAVSLVILQIGSGLFWGGSRSLLLAEIVSTFIMLIFLNRSFRFEVDVFPNFLNLKIIKWNIIKYTRFVVIETPSHFILTLVARLPIIMISLMYGVTQAGLYGLTYQIVQLPNRHFGGNFGDIIQMEAGKLAREGNSFLLIKLIRRYTIILLGLGLIPFLLIMLFAPSVFPLILGKEWDGSGQIAQILAPWMFAALVVPTVSRILLVIQRQDIKLLFNIIMLASLVCLFIVSYFLDVSFSNLLVAISTIIVSIYFVYYLVIYRSI